MGKKQKRENPARIQPSVESSNTKIQLSADTYNGVRKDIASNVTDIDDVLSILKLAPKTPAIAVNNRYEPSTYGLPQSVQNIITEICTKKQVPTEFVLSPLLAVAGAAAGRKAVLKGRGYENSPGFWCAVVAAPGSNKSHPQKLICEPLTKLNERLVAAHNEAIREWKVQCAEISKKSKDDSKALPPQPPKCRVYASDTTREALDEILAGSPSGVCQVRDELSGWLADLDRYGKSGESQTLISYWNGYGAFIDRKGEAGTRVVGDVLYNTCGTIQPGMLSEGFKSQHIASGFIHRFIFFWPQVIPAKRIERNPIEPDMSQWVKLFNNLADLRDTNTVLSLSEEANEVAMGFEEWLEYAKSDSQTSDYEKGVLSKLDIIMLRLACVARMLAIADGDNSHEVTSTEMKWACDLCRYLHQTQMRVYEELQSGSSKRPMNDRELIRTFFNRFERKGVTQGKLAKLLNTSQPYISQCVNPKSKPQQEIESTE